MYFLHILTAHFTAISCQQLFYRFPALFLQIRSWNPSSAALALKLIPIPFVDIVSPTPWTHRRTTSACHKFVYELLSVSAHICLRLKPLRNWFTLSYNIHWTVVPFLCVPIFLQTFLSFFRYLSSFLIPYHDPAIIEVFDLFCNWQSSSCCAYSQATCVFWIFAMLVRVLRLCRWWHTDDSFEHKHDVTT